MTLEILRHLQGVLGNSLASQTQRLNSEEELLRVERTHASAQVAKNFHPDTDDEGERAESIQEFQTMEPRCGIIELWESHGVLSPVKFARIHHYAADRGAVATDPLCCTMHGDMSS